MPFDIAGDWHYRCPLKLISSISWEYLQAYRFYKMGLLPNGIIYQNESKKYLDAMMIIEGEFAKIEEEKIKKAKKNG